MPYRLDISSSPPDAFDILVRLGALDLEVSNGRVAAIMPDAVSSGTVAAALDLTTATTSAAVARDDGSVWLLHPGAVRIGSIVLAPPGAPTGAHVAPFPTIWLSDSGAFGTGHHPSTALCIEALENMLSEEPMDSILDVGTGSGVLAFAALTLGVPQALGLDIDPAALEVAARNARLNNLTHRFQLVSGGPQTVEGTWPLVVANLLAAPLMDMSSVLVRRVGKGGRLILSGIAASLDAEVKHCYQHLGMRLSESHTQNGWTMLLFRTSW